jgi:hypothetical protein
MEEMEKAPFDDLPGKEEGRSSIWKAVLIALVMGLLLFIALGVLRFWMVNYYGGW